MSYNYGIKENYTYEIFFPVGCITAYIGTQTSGQPGYDPDGWLVCDGRTGILDTDIKYSSLKLLLGSANLPNLNAAFLRGAGAYDADHVGPSLRNFDGDKIKSHNHDLPLRFEDQDGGTAANVVLFNETEFIATTDQTFAFGQNVGSNDTRPINSGVKWIIKY